MLTNINTVAAGAGISVVPACQPAAGPVLPPEGDTLDSLATDTGILGGDESPPVCNLIAIARRLLKAARSQAERPKMRSDQSIFRLPPAGSLLWHRTLRTRQRFKTRQ